MPYYVTFLLDLAGNGENRALPQTVRYEPDPKTVPKNAFHWKVICDAAGNVIVRGFDKKLRVLASARWEGGDLAKLKQFTAGCPTPYQWNLVEKAIFAEQAKRAAVSPPDLGAIEDIAEAERELSDRDRDWSERDVAQPMGAPAFDHASYASQRKRRIVLAFIGLGGTLMSVAVVTSIVSGTKKKPATPPTPVAVPEVPRQSVPDPAVQPPKPVEPAPPTSPEESIVKAQSLTEAIAIAKPSMTDSSTELGSGSLLLARYATAKMVLADVNVPAETTLPLVLKDPEMERGKRLCVTGQIDRIERRDLEKRKVFVGRMHTTDDDAVEFVAVGTTGELVKRSTSKFCGVVIGRANDAAKLVGMFDLPENATPLVEQ